MPGSPVSLDANVSGITLAGNAWQWWDHADGAYARARSRNPAACWTSAPTGGCGLATSRW